MVESERYVDGKTSKEVRYYISSLAGDAERLLEVVRGHWGVENSAHWTLDVSFGEDDSRVSKDNGAEMFAALRRMALNMLKQETFSAGRHRSQTQEGRMGQRLSAKAARSIRCDYPGMSMSLSSCSGFLISANIPFPMRFRAVSFPATRSAVSVVSCSSLVSLSPCSSTSIKAVIMSSAVRIAAVQLASRNIETVLLMHVSLDESDLR